MKQDEEDPVFRPLCKLERGPGGSKQEFSGSAMLRALLGGLCRMLWKGQNSTGRSLEEALD